MSIIMSCNDGKWSESGTWAVLDSGLQIMAGAASYQNIPTNIQQYGSVATGILNSGIIDGIAFKFLAPVYNNYYRASLHLLNNTIVASGYGHGIYMWNSGSSATINYDRGWQFFKFENPLYVTGNTIYKPGLYISGSNMPSLAIRSAIDNWSCLLRRQENTIPQSGDTMIIVGENTGYGPATPRTVIMDNTGMESYGQEYTSNHPFSIHVCNSGRLKFDTSTGINTYLKWNGSFGVTEGGILEIGSSDDYIPDSSTATLHMNSITNGSSSLLVERFSELRIHGYPMNNHYSLLNANVYSGNNVLSVDSTSGWKSGDLLYLAPTSGRNVNYSLMQNELNTIDSVDSATQLTLKNNVGYLHEGSGLVRAEIGNLSRNVLLKGNGQLLAGSALINMPSKLDVKYMECRYIGSYVSSDKYSFKIAIPDTSLNFNVNPTISYSTFYSGYYGLYVIDTSYTKNMLTEISNNIMCYNSSNGLLNTNSTNENKVVRTHPKIINNLIAANSNRGFQGDCRGIISGCRFAGNGGQDIYLETSYGIVTDCNLHNSYTALALTAVTTEDLLIKNCSIFRPQYGISTDGANSLTMKDCTIVGTITPITITESNNILFERLTIGGEASYATNQLISCNSTVNIKFVDCDFNNPAYMPYAGSTVSFSVVNSLTNPCVIYVKNCKNNTVSMSALPTVQNPATRRSSYISFVDHNQVTGDNRIYTAYGIERSDTGIFYNSSPSLRLNPQSTGNYLCGAYFQAPVNKGSQYNVSVKVRNSSLADGFAYNGLMPQLCISDDEYLKNGSDIVLDTATTAASGAWTALTGITPIAPQDMVFYFYIRCGYSGYSQGWVNVDEWR